MGNNNLIFEKTLSENEIEKEDSGQFFSFSLVHNELDDKDNGIYVRVCSWDENKIHEDFNKLFNKKIKVTIEVID